MASHHRQSPAEQVSKNIEYRVRSLRRMLRGGVLSKGGPDPIDRRLRLMRNRRKVFSTQDHTGSRTRSRSQPTRSQREEEEPSDEESDDSEAATEDHESEEHGSEELMPWEREQRMKQRSGDSRHTTTSPPSMTEVANQMQ